MTGIEVIQKHLGGKFITKEMEKQADQFLGRIGWIMSERKGKREIWYECCGHTLHEELCTDPDELEALYTYDHRKPGRCPYCNAAIRYMRRRHAGKDDYTQVYTVWYRMSQAEPNTLLVLGMWSGRRWYKVKTCGADPREIRTEHEACSLVVLPWDGKPLRYVREVLKGHGSYDSWLWGTRAAQDSGGWVKRDRVEGGDRQSITGAPIEYIICGDLTQTVCGTRWAKPVIFADTLRNIYCTRDRVWPLSLFCTHPAMEYMLGNGMEGLVRSCMRHDGSLSLIRWKQKKPQDMLQLDGNELARLRRMDPAKVNTVGLLALRKAREYGQRVKLEDAMQAGTADKLSYSTLKDVRAILDRWGNRYGAIRILRYCGQQHGRLSLWRDYMNELAQLGEADDPARVFPRDLHTAHAETAARIRYSQDARTGEKVIRRAELLKGLAFEACGLRLEPFRTAEEIVREGSMQHICIGSYVTSYADGRTILLKLRRAGAPDEPFHAVELRKDLTLVQCRGFRNQTWAEDEAVVRAFWKAWDAVHGTKTTVRLDIAHHKEAKTA